jgi:hypothetical protein
VPLTILATKHTKYLCRTAAGTVRGWESSDDEETSIVPTVDKTTIPTEEKAMPSVINNGQWTSGDDIGEPVISLPANHNGGGNEVNNSMALLSLDESAGTPSPYPTLENQSPQVNALPGGYRPIITTDGMINLVMTKPDGLDELDMYKAKYNVDPRQVSPAIPTLKSQATGHKSLPIDDRKTASMTGLDFYDPLNQPWGL